jgi:DNA-binding Xre family transcriptional regulator
LFASIKNNTLKVRDLDKICKILNVDMNLFFGNKNKVSNSNVSRGDHNSQGINSEIKNSTQQNEGTTLIERIKTLEKECKDLRCRLKICQSDKEMYKKIIDKGL